ncbi:unnamed protein product [Rotaria sp. Silwood2]|nr:unnamed protein product [Rotaria sp. Silwood2]CAF2993539.1 unnamed protein product [Rotaria sp. Silwood2]CAF4143512.1 unnamed protein product [Rotaria sp. Silwood2]CAF4201160.1 unnamed protein product [Rotaria sp. Silwood2]
MTETKNSRQHSFLFECFQIGSLCLVWYSSSAAGNVIVKELLNKFPFPLTVTLVQLLSIWILCIPLIRLWKVSPPEYLNQNRIYYFKVIIPLAIGKFLAQLSSHISLWKVPISYAHTIKATMPLFTVFLSRLILHEKQTTSVYLSLIPVVVGVIIATMTEISFNMTGLISALLSTFGFSLQNIYSKKSLKDIAIHHFILLSLLAKIGCCLFIPFWFFYDGVDIYNNKDYHQYNLVMRVLFYLILDGILNFIHNVVAFTIISLVSPLSYSIANSTKRIVVISISLLILRNPVTITNIIGMSLAVFGVMSYNKAKYDQRRAQHKDAILPLVRSEPTLPSLNHDDLQSSHPIAELTSRHHQVPMESRLSISYENQTFKDV